MIYLSRARTTPRWFGSLGNRLFIIAYIVKEKISWAKQFGPEGIVPGAIILFLEFECASFSWSSLDSLPEDESLPRFKHMLELSEL
jgi:hypothetical protein